MSHFRPAVAGLMLALGLGACTDTGGAAASRSPIAPELIDTRLYRALAIDWRANGQSLFAWRVKEEQGRTAVCGAFAVEGPGPLVNVSEQVLREARIVADGETIVTNLSFFRRDTVPDDDRTEASCVLTERPWEASLGTADVRMLYPRRTYEY